MKLLHEKADRKKEEKMTNTPRRMCLTTLLIRKIQKFKIRYNFLLIKLAKNFEKRINLALLKSANQALSFTAGESV